jgi:arylsulfatase A-like enzyme
MASSGSQWPIVLAMTGFLALPANGPRGSALAAIAGAPHIVVIMVDDLDTQTAEVMLAIGLLPNLQRYVVGRGVRFSQSFVTSSLSCPTRATYLTGRYAHNHGALRNNADPGGTNGGAPSLADASTLATWLQGVGYRTSHVGKYLNEYGLDPSAELGSPRNPSYVPPGWDDWQALVDPWTYLFYGYRLNDNRTIVQYGNSPEDYQTAVVADRSRRFITGSLASFPGRPLFLTVAPVAPHVDLIPVLLSGLDGFQYPDIWRWFPRPDSRDQTVKPGRWGFIFQVPLLPSLKPSFNEADVTDKPPSVRRAAMTAPDISSLTLQYRMRLASMLAADDLVGAVAVALGDQLANTVFVFTSDNGFLHGEHRMSDKSVAYEESIRVPLYIAAPGVAGPRTVDAIVLDNDLAPTLAELAGAVPSPPADGRSLVPLLAGPAPAEWRKRFLVEYWTSGDLVFDVPSYAAVRTGSGDVRPQRLYAEYYAEALAPATVTDLELYDLTVDPYELQSVHADPGRLFERDALRAQLAGLRTCGTTGAPSCPSLEN